MQKSIALVGSQAFSLINFRGDLIVKLVSGGIKVYALAPDFSIETRNKIFDLGAMPIDCPMSRSGKNPILDIYNWFALAYLLFKLKPDVFFGFTIKPVIYGTLASWIARVPKRFCMIEGLGFVFTDYGVKPPFSREFLKRLVLILYRLSLSKAESVIFLNRDDIEDFLKKAVLPLKKIQYVNGIGVNVSEWKSYNAVKSPLTFLFAARLLREKGIYEFIEAAQNIKNIDPDIRFIVLGDIDLNPGSLTRDELELWVNEGIIEWPGHVDVKSWMEQSSVFVLPSFYREGVPRSIQEAMAMGLPIITTNSPGCKDTVVDGENGYLIEVRNTKQLETAMLSFISNPQLISSMGSASRRIAVEKFDVEKINQRLINIFGL